MGAGLRSTDEGPRQCLPHARQHDRASHQQAATGKGVARNQALGRSRGGLTTKIHLATDTYGRPLRWSRGEARWLGPCGHHSVSSPRSSNRTCGFPASGFPTGFTSKHTTVGQDGPDVVGSHRTPRTRPYRGNAWCLATTPCGRFRLRLDVELPPMAPELLGCCQDHRHSPLLAIIKSAQEVRALCSAGITRPHSSYGPVRRPRGPSPKVTSRA